MRVRNPRFSVARLERVLERLDGPLTPGDRLAIHDLTEISRIFETVQACLIAIEAKGKGRRKARPLVGQIGQWLVDIQIELFEHLPMHLKDLRRNLGALVEKVCELDEEGDPTRPG
jgi:hypothetical protein